MLLSCHLQGFYSWFHIVFCFFCILYCAFKKSEQEYQNKCYVTPLFSIMLYKKVLAEMFVYLNAVAKMILREDL